MYLLKLLFKIFISLTFILDNISVSNAWLQPESFDSLHTETQEYREFVSDQFSKSVDDAVRSAGHALEGKLGSLKAGTNVSDICLNHTEMFLEGVAVYRQDWAFRMLDAMGKPPSQLLNYQLHWLGSYDECVAIEATVNVSGQLNHPYKGRYCTATFPLSKSAALSVGVCVPNSCSSNDTAGLLDTLLSLIPMNTTSLPTPKVTCQLEKIDYDTKAIVALVICSLFGLLMLVATAYDVIVIHWISPNSTTHLPSYKKLEEETVHQCDKDNVASEEKISIKTAPSVVANGYGTHLSEPSGENVQNKFNTQVENNYKPGILGRVLLSFSVYTNAQKILNSNQPPGTLSAVNGIRFVSMTWVVLGHTYFFSLSTGTMANAALFLPEMFKRLTFQAISNATVCVDTFFVLSGLLVSYLSLKEMKKRRGARRFQWGMFYFHRFWRLTPPYMLFLMVYVCLMKYWSNGPMWPQNGTEVDNCKDSWWENLLYINNFDKTQMCMGWSWYLANDMQFYVLSPLMLIPLYYSSLLGAISCGVLLLIPFISTGIISSNRHIGINMFQADGADFEEIYFMPYCRIGPYVVGFFTGYILYKTECKIKIPKIFNLLGWATAAAIALLVLYGLYDSSGMKVLSNDLSAFYNATNRTAWGLAMSWVVFACATGHGGWVNTLLSWKGIIPLSRLTYTAYLVHPVVMETYYLSRRNLIEFSDIEAVYLFCGHLCLTFATAFVVSLAFESPMMGLEKVLLKREKKS